MFGKKNLVRAVVSCILAVALMIPLSLPAFAANTEDAVREISFLKEGVPSSLKVLQKAGAWYVEANSLAEASGSKLSINKLNGQVSLYRGEDITILYKANKKTYINHEDEYFLPLQEATVSVGLQFSIYKDDLHARQLKVPAELITDLSVMFRNSKYSTTQMIIDLGPAYTAINVASRIYAILPFVGSSNIMEEATGAGERNRYEAAFATILANEGELSELIADTKTFQGEIKHSNKILETSQKILDKDSPLADFLNEKGVDSKLLKYFTTEISPYSPEGEIMEWFSSFATVTEAMNVGEFLNLATFYATAIDAEESMARAMVSVFENSENARAREAAINVHSLRYGNKTTAGTSFYAEWFGDRIFDLICKKAEKQLMGLKGIAQLRTLAITKAIDFGTGASDKSNAVLYTSVYSSIQQELASYYYNHVYDADQQTAMILRGVGLMYLKAALAAYENYEFDKDISQAINNAKTMITAELAKILAYSEEEYCPEYDNACLAEWAALVFAGEKENPTEKEDSQVEKEDGQTEKEEVTTDRKEWRLVKYTEVTKAANGKEDPPKEIYYTYDSNGNLATERYVGYTEDEGTNSYTYDANNNLVKYDGFAQDDFYERVISTYNYDASGRLLSETNKGEWDTKTSTYTYNAEGLRILKEIRGSGRNESYTYTYDAGGRVLAETYNGPSTERESYTYTYDAKGRLLSKTEKTLNGYNTWHTYTYDSNGNKETYVCKTEYPPFLFPFDSEEYSYRYTYDSRGKVLTETCDYQGKGGWNGSRTNTSNTVYTYDSEGNVLTKETTEYIASGEVRSTTVCTYEYEECVKR